MKRFIILLSLLISGPAILSNDNFPKKTENPSICFEWKDVGRGAQYAQFQGEVFGNQQCISVFRYPTKKFITDIVNDSGLLEPKKPDMPGAVNPDAPATTVSGFAERYDAIAVINGSYFNMKTLYPATFVRDDGEQEGLAKSDESFRVNGAVCANERKVRIISSDTTDYFSNFKGYRDVLASGPILIIDGKMMDGWPDDSFFTGRHPRTAVGISGGYTYLIVIDGRFPGLGLGMTIAEVTELCHLIGCSDAINLDGGGSSTMWVKSQGVISHPYDNKKWDNGGERIVPNAIVVR